MYYKYNYILRKNLLQIRKREKTKEKRRKREFSPFLRDDFSLKNALLG